MDTKKYQGLIVPALLFGFFVISRFVADFQKMGMGEKRCRCRPPVAEQMAPHAAALWGISRGPLDALFSSGSSHDSILKLVFAAADG